MSRDRMVAPPPLSRPLRWWSATALDVLARRFAPAWQSWGQDWGIDVGDLRAFNANEAATQAFQWMPLNASGAQIPGAWASVKDSSPSDLLGNLLFGTNPGRPTSPMAADVSAKAWVALEAQIALVLQPASSGIELSVTEQIPTTETKPWSGAVRLQCQFAGVAGASLWLHLGVSQAAKLSSAGQTPKRLDSLGKPRFVSVVEAVSHLPVRFSAEFNAAELSLGTLQSLRVGDVLTLPHRLDAPLTVLSQPTSSSDSTSPAHKVCFAYLGARDGHRAIELVRSAGELA